MIKPVIWTEEALADAEEIVSYVASTFGSAAAQHAINEMYENVELLPYFPYHGTALTSYPPYRVVHSKRNIIIYAIQDDFIEITHVSDSRRDDKTIKDILKSRNKQ